MYLLSILILRDVDYHDDSIVADSVRSIEVYSSGSKSTNIY